MSDLISRRKAIEALFDWEMTYDWDEHCREEDPKPAYIVSPSDVIEQLPSAQPEQPKMVQDILQYLDEYLHPIVSPEHWSVYSVLYDMVSVLPSAQPDKRLEKIADLVEGTIDHFDRDDAMDLLYQIKEVLNER